MKKYIVSIVLSLICTFFSFSVFSQQSTSDSLRKKAPNVYIDCETCDKQHIKREIPYINYMRDRKDADIHLLITRESTGSGGDEFTIYFLGQKQFEHHQDTLRFSVPPDATQDEIRTKGVETIKKGIIPYVFETPIREHITVSYDKSTQSEEVEDKWNKWVFRSSLRAWISGEASRLDMNFWGTLSATKITKEWKIEMDLGGSYSEDRFKVNDQTITGIRRSQSFDVLAVNSINQHWSMGGFFDFQSSLYSNYEQAYRVSPAVEYNLFPYRISTRRQLRFLYKPTFKYNVYTDTTIFNKTQEQIFTNRLAIALALKEKWGRVDVGLEGSHFFNDLAKNKLTFDASLSLKLVKGLSFDISGRLSLINDQINLRKGQASKEDILLKQQELPTQYSYYANFGLSYTFGSIYNNIVNPRFGN
jgi:hypothetical protein